MTTSREKVLELIASGKVTAAEGDALLAAIAPPRPSLWKRVVNPFDSISLGIGLSLGALSVGAAMVLVPFKVRFDGALDVHAVDQAVSLSVAAIEQAIAWPGVALVLWLAALPFARTSRFIDFLNAVAVARLPLLFIGIIATLLAPYLPRTNEESLGSKAMTALAVLAPVALAGLVLSLIWFFNGSRHASGLKGPKAAAVFIVAIVLAELLSKVALAELT